MPKIRGKPITIYIGVDPGQNGGLSAILNDQSIIRCDPTPETEKEVYLWFENLHRSSSIKYSVCIEWIHPAIQGVGKSSMSKLYGSYMSLRMALTAAELPYEIIMPRFWQAALSISSRKKTENQTKWKNRLREKSQQLFPLLPLWKEPRTKGKQLAICDSLLIAEYCRRKHEGLL